MSIFSFTFNEIIFCNINQFSNEMMTHGVIFSHRHEITNKSHKKLLTQNRNEKKYSWETDL